ncbi:MAG: hypothetical protein RXP30_06795 [Thermoplasmata archaeon]
MSQTKHGHLLPEKIRKSFEDLTRNYENLLKKSGANANISLLIHAASLYGSTQMLMYLLARKCESQAERTIELAKDAINQLINYNEGNEEEARKLNIRFAMLEALIYQVVSQCEGVDN